MWSTWRDGWSAKLRCSRYEKSGWWRERSNYTGTQRLVEGMALENLRD